MINSAVEDVREVVSDEAWDAFVSAHPDGHHEQSSEFARHRERQGFSYDRVVLVERGELVGGAQVLVQSSAFGKYAQILRGPLARQNDLEILSELAQRIRKVAQDRCYAAVTVQTFLEQGEARQVLENCGFRSTTVWAEARRSYRIPLDRTDEELLNAMHYNVRRYTRRLAKNDDVAVVVGDASAVGDFHVLHEQTASFQGFPIFPEEYFRYLWRTFGPAGRVQHFVVYFRGKPIAAIFNTVVRDTMYYGWGGIDRGENERKLHANLLLHFTAARWARDQRCRFYDLCGIERFKRQLGLEEVQWPQAQRALFGSTRGVRERIMQVTWGSPYLRQSVTRFKRRLYDPSQVTW
jgi:lipid II:glycine glycyltransferase (peptidoglycan interpeptide bridge formation enzyme)